MNLIRRAGRWFFGSHPVARLWDTGRKKVLPFWRWKRLPREPRGAWEARFWAWVRSTTRAKHNRIKRRRAKKGYR